MIRFEGGLDAAANLIGCEAPDDVERNSRVGTKGGVVSPVVNETPALCFDSVRAGTDMACFR